MNAKVSIARLSIISNTLLIIMKLAVGLISGSVRNAHQYCDKIENELTSNYENLVVTIHVEPS